MTTLNEYLNNRVNSSDTIIVSRRATENEKNEVIVHLHEYDKKDDKNGKRLFSICSSCNSHSDPSSSLSCGPLTA
jgi:cytochrome c2